MDQSQVDAIYGELESLIIELAPDPFSKGPQYLQDLISKTRGYLNKTSLILQKVLREQHALERNLTALEAAFEVSSDCLLAEDHNVSSLPSIEDRRAKINILLKDEKAEIQKQKKLLRELSFVEKVVKHRHKELDNTMSAIRMQKSLVDSEVHSGSFYGDESDVSRNKKRTRPQIGVTEDADTLDEEEGTNSLLAEILSEPTMVVADAQEPDDDDPFGLNEVQVVAPSEVPPQSSEDDPDIARFLDGVAAKPADPESPALCDQDDLFDLFDQL